MKEKPKHAFFAPSASHRWMPCPASLHLSKDLPEEKPSEHAHEGIVCHSIAALCLKNGIPADHYLGQVVEEVTMTQELVDGIQMYVDEIRGISKEIGAKGGKIEHEVDITDECWGTIDALIWNESMAVIVDLKMGKGVIVEAEENPQLMLYAVGGLKYLLQEHKLSPSQVSLRIIQPRTVNPIRTTEMDRKELIVWFQKEVQPVMAKAQNGNAECMPGVEQCRWCPVSATCKAQMKFMMTEAEGAFSEFIPDVPPNEGGTSIHMIAKLLPKFEQIQTWIRTVQEYALTQALSGNRIPGYKVVHGRSVRKWGADEDVIVHFLKTKCNTEPYEQKLISPTIAEKALGKKNAEQLGLDKYVTKPPGKPTLVLESDKRPEIEDTVEQEFQEFIPDQPILIDSKDDPEEVKQMSALDRMRMSMSQDEDVPEDKEVGEPSTELSRKLSDSSKEIFAEIATSGNPVEEDKVIVEVKPKEIQKSPKAGTKRLDVLNFGEGGVTVKSAAQALGCSENMIKMHLRYLNEQNGYGYVIYNTGEFIITES